MSKFYTPGSKSTFDPPTIRNALRVLIADKTLGNVPAVGIKLYYWTTTYSLVATWWKRTAQGQVGRISTEQILPIVKDRFWMALLLTCLAIDRFGDHGDVIAAWSFFALIAWQPHQIYHSTTTAPITSPSASTAPRVWRRSIAQTPPPHHGLTTLITRHHHQNTPNRHHRHAPHHTHRMNCL